MNQGNGYQPTAWATVEVIGLRLDTMREIETKPELVGETLAQANRLGEAVLGGLEAKLSDKHEDPLSQIADGLAMAEVVQWKSVRFPKLHRLLGRIVVTDENGHSRHLYQNS